MAVSCPNHAFLEAQSSAFGSGVPFAACCLLSKLISGFDSFFLLYSS